MRQVLLVDDSPNITAAMQRHLRSTHFGVKTANSADQALKMLRAEEFDLLVSDYLMPGMNGLSLLRHCKEAYPRLIRVMLTAHSDRSTLLSAVNEAAVHRFLCKPLNPLDLAFEIKEALKLGDSLRVKDDLTELVRMQSNYIEYLEHEYPGISKLRSDAQGVLQLDLDHAEAARCMAAYDTTPDTSPAPSLDKSQEEK